MNKIPYTTDLPDDIVNLSEFIYGQKDGKIFCQKLQPLLACYRLKIPPVLINELSPKDNLLILYGDQVYGGKEKTPLQTTSEIVQKYTGELISGLHILPFFPSTSDDGFAISDYKALNPQMGTWADIEQICDSFQVMFDAVLNHVSASHEWVRGHLADNPEFSDFCIEAKPEPTLSKVVRPRTHPLLSEFSHQKKGRIQLWTTFSPDQVDLNFENPKVLLKIIDVLLYYVEKGARFIRLDAVAFLWKEIGTDCIHHPKTHAIIRLIRHIFNSLCPHVRLITETNVPHRENISYFGQGDEAHLIYQFALPPLIAHAVCTAEARYLFSWAQNLKMPDKGCCFFNFTASHDGIGLRPVQDILPASEIEFLTKRAIKHGGHISSRTDPIKGESPYEINISYIDLLSSPQDTEESLIQRFLLSQAIALSLPGLPGIYFHSLFGSRSWPEGVRVNGAKRAINREKIRVDILEQELQNKKSFRAKILHKYLHLLEIRQKIQAFSPESSFTPFMLHPSCFSFRRGSGTETLISIHNLSDKTISLDLRQITNSPSLKNQFDDKIYKTSSIELSPLQTVWLI